MQDYETIDILKDAIYIDGNCPDIVIDGGFTVDDISDISFTTNTPDFVSGTCALDTTHPEGGSVPLYGDFEIAIDGNGEYTVTFGDFDLE